MAARSKLAHTLHKLLNHLPQVTIIYLWVSTEWSLPSAAESYALESAQSKGTTVFGPGPSDHLNMHAEAQVTHTQVQAGTATPWARALAHGGTHHPPRVCSPGVGCNNTKALRAAASGFYGAAGPSAVWPSEDGLTVAPPRLSATLRSDRERPTQADHSPGAGALAALAAGGRHRVLAAAVYRATRDGTGPHSVDPLRLRPRRRGEASDAPTAAPARRKVGHPHDGLSWRGSIGTVGTLPGRRRSSATKETFAFLREQGGPSWGGGLDFATRSCAVAAR